MPAGPPNVEGAELRIGDADGAAFVGVGPREDLEDRRFATTRGSGDVDGGGGRADGGAADDGKLADGGAGRRDNQDGAGDKDAAPRRPSPLPRTVGGALRQE